MFIPAGLDSSKDLKCRNETATLLDRFTLEKEI